MKAFSICFFLFFMATLSSYGQTFSFTQMSNPDPNQNKIYDVLMLENEALAGGSTVGLYYDGSSWNQLNTPTNQPVLPICGTKRSNGDIQAVYMNYYGFYAWNNVSKSWQSAGAKPTAMSAGARGFFLAEDQAFFVSSDNENYGWIWWYNGTEFTSLKSDYWYSYPDLWAKDSNTLFLITGKNVNYDARLIRYNNLTKSNLVLYTFPNGRETPHVIRSKDNNIFFVLTYCGDLYRWTESQAKMDLIYEASAGDYNYFGEDLIVIDNNNVITCGYGGIRHLKVDASQLTVIYPTANTFSIWGASYNGQGRAMFVGHSGLILDMQVIGSVPDEDIADALNLYPNPAENSVTLEFPVFGVNEKTVELYSSTGQLVQKETFQSFKTELDISALPSGIYLVNVKDETGKKLASKKLLVR